MSLNKTKLSYRVLILSGTLQSGGLTWALQIVSLKEVFYPSNRVEEKEEEICHLYVHI